MRPLWKSIVAIALCLGVHFAVAAKPVKFEESRAARMAKAEESLKNLATFAELLPKIGPADAETYKARPKGAAAGPAARKYFQYKRLERMWAQLERAQNALRCTLDANANLDRELYCWANAHAFMDGLPDGAYALISEGVTDAPGDWSQAFNERAAAVASNADDAMSLVIAYLGRNVPPL